MIIDGEKWACEACVRGHRVSNCQHSDRPLQHINKKGRPVSQCHHCRAMRKSRSSHIKCDCGEKTSKCAHLQPTVEGHTETCCCNHGGRCSCAHKKELQPTLDTVPESDSDGEVPIEAPAEAPSKMPAASRPKLAARRRRANTIHSGDGSLSFDHNGNHRPAGKSSRPSQKVGPYQLNRVNSATSSSSLGTGSDGMPETRVGPAGQRRVKSEATSPLMAGSGFQMNGSVPPLDLSGLDYAYAPNSGSGSFDLFGAGFSPDNDAPLYSAGLSTASVDWSHYDFPGDSLASSAYSQGVGNFTDMGSNSENMPNLVNTTSTSGDVSEVEDPMPGADDFTGNFMRPGMLANNADLSSIDYDSFYKSNADQNPIAGTGMSMVEDDPAFWMPNYNESMTDSVDPLEQPTQAAAPFWDL